MPEPLSIATSIAGLLKATWTIGVELKKFHDGVSTISKTLSDLENDVDALANVLGSMRQTFESITAATGTGDLATHWKNVAKAIDDGNGIIRELGDELQDINKTTNFLDAARKQLRMNFADDKLAALRIRVHSLRETLQLSLQAITITNQVSHHGDLMDVCEEIRRLAKKMNETIDAQHAVGQSHQAEMHVTEMITFRECVRSAASIVSSASTAIRSEKGEDDRSTVIMSDFGDCFPRQQNLALSRWMEAPSVHGDGQDRSLPPPQSVVDIFSVDESADSSDSDIDLEDEMTTTLLEEGQQKLAAGDWEDAERIFKKCSARLSNVTWEQRGGHAARQFSKHCEVLQCLFGIFQEQERWSEAQNALTQKLNVGERMNRKKDLTYIGDLFALARILQRRGDTIQARLHARRALKGFKKLKSTDDIKSCLVLLIELCSADNGDDDQEVYTIMLSRMEFGYRSPSEEAAPKVSASILDSTDRIIPPMHQIEQDTGGIAAGFGPGHSTLDQYASSDMVPEEESTFSISKQKPEVGGEMLPYDTRSEYSARQRDARFLEVLPSNEMQVQIQSIPPRQRDARFHEVLSWEETQVKPQNSPRISATGADDSLGLTPKDQIKKSSGGDAQTTIEAEIVTEPHIHDAAEADSGMDCRNFDVQSVPEVDATDGSTAAQLNNEHDYDHGHTLPEDGTIEDTPVEETPAEGTPPEDTPVEGTPVERPAQTGDPMYFHPMSESYLESDYNSHQLYSGDHEDERNGDDGGEMPDANAITLRQLLPTPPQAEIAELTRSDYLGNVQEDRIATPSSHESSLPQATNKVVVPAGRLDGPFDAQAWALSIFADMTESTHGTNAAQGISKRDDGIVEPFRRSIFQVDQSHSRDDEISELPANRSTITARNEPTNVSGDAIDLHTPSATPGSEYHFDRTPETPFTSRLSSTPSTNSSIFASGATAATSETTSSASTNVTEPLTPAWEDSFYRPRATDMLHNTPSRQRRRVGLGDLRPISIPRRPLPQGAVGDTLELVPSTDTEKDNPTAILRLNASNLCKGKR